MLIVGCGFACLTGILTLVAPLPWVAPLFPPGWGWGRLGLPVLVWLGSPAGFPFLLGRGRPGRPLPLPSCWGSPLGFSGGGAVPPLGVGLCAGPRSPGVWGPRQSNDDDV